MGGWPFDPPIAPMEARVRAALPPPPGWAYEPKWDGFRALAWSAGADGEPRLDSRNRRPLLRYFPELRAALESLPGGTVADGEIVVVRGDATDFDALQQRIHPAASRVERLARETPARIVAFDLPAHGGEDLRARPFAERRERLEALLAALPAPWSLTPSTRDAAEAGRWASEFARAGCDGVVAKRLDAPYAEGAREMLKVKRRRTLDAVVGGYRLHKEGDRVGSLLLGLYDGEGRLHFVGHVSGFADGERAALLARLEPLRAEASFGEEARRPGMESRWTGDRDASFVALRPELVAEVGYDQTTGYRLRHAARFLRWRPDKDPAECALGALARAGEGAGFASVVGARPDGGG